MGFRISPLASSLSPIGSSLSAIGCLLLAASSLSPIGCLLLAACFFLLYGTYSVQKSDFAPVSM